MSELAAELNRTLEAENPATLGLLSTLGKAAFFPSKGILGQAGQAKGRTINATIGIALDEDGTPLRLPCLADKIQLAPKDAFPYAPSYGKPALRSQWKQMLLEKNPGLKGDRCSLPVVSCALTHALSIVGKLLLDEGDCLILPELFWGNYKLVFKQACGAQLATFSTFEGGGFNLGALKDALAKHAGKKRVVLLNFPNNPTGYTPTIEETNAMVDMLREAAEQGPLAVVVDDAYFGLVYKEGVATESIFSALSSLHPNLLAIKVDGATKEDYAWGFRVGFITYGNKSLGEAGFKALEAKTAGLIRGNLSNAPHLSQSLLLEAYQSDSYKAEKQRAYDLMKKRFDTALATLEEHPEYAEAFEAMPVNSGYFMCVRPLKGDPEALRVHLVEKYDTGLIATAGLLRIAFSSTPTDRLPQLFANLYAACQDLAS